MSNDPTSYKGNEVNICASLCKLVYEQPHKIRINCKNILPSPSLTIRTFRNFNSRIVVITSNNNVYVVFRGTVLNSWKSWKANLKISRTRWMKGKVHTGFFAVFKQARLTYNYIINKHNNANIYFLGHSQGGAAAYLAAVDKVKFGRASHNVCNITYGQPRTGNKQFSRYAEKRIGHACTRVTNSCDLVVGVPLVWQGYDHFRFSFHYKRGKVIRRRSAPGATWVAAPLWWRHYMKAYAVTASKNKTVNL